MKRSIESIMNDSGVSFGTSGVRGLVSAMTDAVCVAYVKAFLLHMKQSGFIGEEKRIGIAGDLRPSTDRIMNACAAACVDEGLIPVNLGKIPSPAIAHYGLLESIPTIMVTGSHIPDDRNGIKFNTPYGEILKSDEQAIKKLEVSLPETLCVAEMLQENYLPGVIDKAHEYYQDRFTDFFPEQTLSGFRVGVYEHSSVARDLLVNILTALGAKVIRLGRSEQFIPVDTEAIREEDILLAKQWVAEYELDCLVSTDGDGDRPLVSDELGDWLRGDIAGVLCAKFLQASHIVTPISSNTALEKSGWFQQTARTRIGSPYVIEAMQQLAEQFESGRVVGYEANGGFLQQTDIALNGKNLTALPTRDAVMVILAVLGLCRTQKVTVSRLVASLPSRYTISDRIKNIPTEISQHWLAELKAQLEAGDNALFQRYFTQLPSVVSVNSVDGLRLELEDKSLVHFRPSGNAPELRCYTEADSIDAAQKLNHYCLSRMAEIVTDISNSASPL